MLCTCGKGLCDYLTYAATYAACRVEPRIKLAFNASHDNGLCWCRGCCCCRDTIVLSGDHPFECEFCGSCFRDDGTLRGHKRIHTGEKPYECNGCGKRFSLKHQLETHYRVHTGKSSERSARSKKSPSGGSREKSNNHLDYHRLYNSMCINRPPQKQYFTPLWVTLTKIYSALLSLCWKITLKTLQWECLP